MNDKPYFDPSRLEHSVIQATPEFPYQELGDPIELPETPTSVKTAEEELAELDADLDAEFERLNTQGLSKQELADLLNEETVLAGGKATYTPETLSARNAAKVRAAQKAKRKKKRK